MATSKRKPGNPNMIKGQPSINQLGSRAGTRNLLTQEVMKGLRDAYAELGGTEYLVQLGREHPNIFASLIAKVMPTDISASVTHTVISLGDAMQLANDRLAEAEARMTIDHEPIQPDQPTSLSDHQPDSLEPDEKTIEG